jgi:hypothetical protein
MSAERHSVRKNLDGVQVDAPVGPADGVNLAVDRHRSETVLRRRHRCCCAPGVGRRVIDLDGGFKTAAAEAINLRRTPSEQSFGGSLLHR